MQKILQFSSTFLQFYLRPKTKLLDSSLAFNLKKGPLRCAKVCDKSWVILQRIFFLLVYFGIKQSVQKTQWQPVSIGCQPRQGLTRESRIETVHMICFYSPTINSRQLWLMFQPCYYIKGISNMSSEILQDIITLIQFIG